jgi:hypothetical protein
VKKSEDFFERFPAALRPWLQVWVSPDPASRQILRSHTPSHLLWSIPLAGLLSALTWYFQPYLAGTNPALTTAAFWFLGGTLVSGIGVWAWSELFFRVGRLNGGRGAKKRVRVGALFSLALGCVTWPITFVITQLAIRSVPLIGMVWWAFFAYLVFIQLKVMANAHSMDLRMSVTTAAMVWAIIGIPILGVVCWAMNQQPVQKVILNWLNSTIPLP